MRRWRNVVPSQLVPYSPEVPEPVGCGEKVTVPAELQPELDREAHRLPEEE